jgi:hypothetical protein
MLLPGPTAERFKKMTLAIITFVVTSVSVKRLLSLANEN